MNVPHFFICPDCGRHGHLVFPNGMTGGEVFSVKEALDDLEWAYFTGLLSLAEHDTVRDEIAASSIPDVDEAIVRLGTMAGILDVILGGAKSGSDGAPPRCGGFVLN